MFTEIFHRAIPWNTKINFIFINSGIICYSSALISIIPVKSRFAVGEVWRLGLVPVATSSFPNIQIPSLDIVVRSYWLEYSGLNRNEIHLFWRKSPYQRLVGITSTDTIGTSTLARWRWRNLNWIRKELCSSWIASTNLYFDRRHFPRHRSVEI